MITYQTNRLLLREAELSDAAFLMDLMNQPDWLAYIGDRQIYSVEAAEEYVWKKLKPCYQQNGFGLLMIERLDDQQKLGLCGLIKRPQFAYPDIGYALHSDFYGFGYAREAAMAVMEDAMRLKVDKLLAITTPTNVRSVNLLNKLGMALEGNVQLEGDAEVLYLFSCKMSS